VLDRARSFDRAAEEYERTRPDYPPEVLDALPLRKDAEVLDVGAGTGKLTRVLAQRYRRVIAVEPLDPPARRLG
jgi:trans-aconitate methyltransferase